MLIPLRILAVSDEVDESFYGDRLPEVRPDLILSCGDLPPDYLEYLLSRLDVPLYYVPGNHDPDLRLPDATWTPLEKEPPIPGPEGCVNIDGKVVDVRGLRIAGLGGSVRYKPGPNQYTQPEMARRALALDLRLRFRRVRSRRKLDILVSHAPPFGFDERADPAHAGFGAFVRLIKTFHPLLAIHGHTHPYGKPAPEQKLGSTRVINVIPSRMIEI